LSALHPCSSSVVHSDVMLKSEHFGVDNSWGHSGWCYWCHVNLWTDSAIVEALLPKYTGADLCGR
jgi:hypothetical protein